VSAASDVAVLQQQQQRGPRRQHEYEDGRKLRHADIQALAACSGDLIEMPERLAVELGYEQPAEQMEGWARSILDSRSPRHINGPAVANPRISA
jgi:hypothetical protein